MRWIATWLITCLLCTSSIAQSLDELRAMAKSGQCHQVIALCDSLENGSMLHQNQPLLADYWNVKANCLRQLGEPILAIQWHEKILNIRRPYFGERSLEVANTYQNLGNCYLQVNRLDKAMPLLEKTLAIRQKKLPQNHLDLATVYLSIGLAHQQKNNFDLAIVFYEKALSIKQIQLGKNSPAIISNLINIGTLLFEQNKIETAKSYFQQALTIQLDSLEHNHPQIPLIYNNLGNCYLQLNNAPTALNYFKKALASVDLEKINPETIINTHFNLGNVYLNMGDFDTALLQFNKALSLQNNEDGLFDFNLLYHIALCFRYKGNLEEAISKFEFIIANYPYQDKFLNIAKENLGTCFLEEGNYDAALFFFEQTLKIYQTFNAKEAYHNVLSKIGDCHFQKQEYDKSEHIYKKLLYTEEKALHHYKLGKVQQKKHQYSQALHHFKRALQLIEANESLQLKTYIFLAKGSVHQALEDWEVALEAYQAAEKTMEAMSQKLENLHANIYLNDEYPDIYDGIIKVAFELGKKNTDFHKLAFQYSEKSKADVLKKWMQYTEKQINSSKRQALLEAKEKVEQIIFQEESKGSLANKTILNNAYAQQYDLQQQLKTKEIAEKVKSDFINIEYLQSQLTDSQSLVNYHLTQNAIFIFHITNQDFKIVEILKSSSFENQLIEFYNSIRTRPDLNAQPDIVFANYTALAFEFYHLLVAPVAQALHKEVIIIPDKLLIYLPFEVLLSQKAKASFLFKEHHYLLHHYDFSYAYATELWLNMREHQRPQKRTQLLTIAPIFDKQTNQRPLAYNIPEAKSIQRITWTKPLIGAYAQETDFKKLANQYAIIHFSTHGEVNNLYPEFSYLAFASPRDTSEDGRLYAAEIYNLSLNAELVFLSACQTNLGKYYSGEGLISLARAFTFAGAKSIIASLWSIDDAQTRYIVTSTYQQFKNRTKKNKALAEAKRQYLLNTEQIYAHPYYWSGLILIGDDVPLTLSSSFSFIIFLGVVILSLVVSSYFYYRK